MCFNNLICASIKLCVIILYGGTLLLMFTPAAIRAQLPLEEEWENLPYPDCPEYQIGGSHGQTYTPDHHLRNGSILYFFPFAEEDTRLNIHITTPNFLFKALVDGKSINLEKCQLMRLRAGSAGTIEHQDCKKEAADAFPRVDFVKPHEWNKVTVITDNKQISVMIGGRIAMTASPLPDSEINRMKWSIHAVPRPSTSNNVKSVPDGSIAAIIRYRVQLDCKDLIEAKQGRSDNNPIVFNTRTYEVTTHRYFQTIEPAAPYNEESSTAARSEPSHKVAITAGVIILICVIVILVLISAYLCMKKCKKSSSQNLEAQPLPVHETKSGHTMDKDHTKIPVESLEPMESIMEETKSGHTMDKDHTKIPVESLEPMESIMESGKSSTN